MKPNKLTEALAQQVINAILQGAHTTEMILRNQHLEAQRMEVCEAMAYLLSEEIIEYSNDNYAHEYGYYISDKGWQII